MFPIFFFLLTNHVINMNDEYQNLFNGTEIDIYQRTRVAGFGNPYFDDAIF